MKKVLFAIACMLIIGFSASAQVVMAVGHDKDGSSEEYKVFKGEYFKALRAAKEWIGSHNVARKEFRESESNATGKGVYVVVRASYLLSDGTTRRTSYGVGASEDSTDEAKKNAVNNLITFDPLWKESYGYDAIESDNFNNNEE